MEQKKDKQVEQKPVKKPEEVGVLFEAMVQAYDGLGKEISAFEQESRTRRIIGELMRPLVEESEVDRRNSAMRDLKISNIDERLNLIEHLFGMADVKPKVFQEIDDKFCDFRIEFQDKFKAATDAAQIGEERNALIFHQIRDFEITLSSIQKLMQIRDGQIGELSQKINIMTAENNANSLQMQNQCEKIEMLVESKMTIVETQFNAVNDKTLLLESLVRQFQSQFESSNDFMIQNKTSIQQLFYGKLDVAMFDKKFSGFEEQLETIRLAVFDNFRVLRSSDNYIEKYLPFQIQNMISRSFLSVFKPPKIIDGAQMLNNEEYQAFQRFKKNEYDVYKEIHRVVLCDDGCPQLKKTAFMMPGYRKVLNANQYYEIDNMDQINRQLETIVPEELVSSSSQGMSVDESPQVSDRQISTSQRQIMLEIDQVQNLQKMFAGKKQPENPYYNHALNQVKTLKKKMEDFVIKEESQLLSIQESVDYGSDQIQNENIQNQALPVATNQSEHKEPTQQIKRRLQFKNLKTVTQSSFGGAKRRSSQLSSIIHSATQAPVSSGVYHHRRRTTMYLVGLEDLEESVSEMITESRDAIVMLKDEINFITKEMTEYKRYIQNMVSQKDIVFQSEVRSCLKEQLYFIQELQSTIGSENNQMQNQIKEFSWNQQKQEKDKQVQIEKNINSKQPRMFKSIHQLTDLIVDYLKVQNILNFELNKQPKEKNQEQKTDGTTIIEVVDVSLSQVHNTRPENEQMGIIQMIDQIRQKFEILQEKFKDQNEKYSFVRDSTIANIQTIQSTEFSSIPASNNKLKVVSGRQQIHKRVMSANMQKGRNMRQMLRTTIDVYNRSNETTNNLQPNKMIRPPSTAFATPSPSFLNTLYGSQNQQNTSLNYQNFN